jgi:hypothetical protein
MVNDIVAMISARSNLMHIIHIFLNRFIETLERL